MSPLTQREKQEIARAASAHGVQVLTSIPAAIYLASPNPKLKKKNIPEDSILRYFPELKPKKWQYTNISGFLTFVVDSRNNAYFFELYDVETFSIRFQQELYYDLDYKELSAQFHCFEIEDCLCGFNFANAEEAAKFHSKVVALCPTKSKKKKQKKQKAAAMLRQGSFANVKQVGGGGANWFMENSQGYDVEEAYEIRDEDLTREWKAILKNAGIRKKDLKKPGMQKIIREILEEANISTTAPPQMTYEEARQYYNEDEVQQYQQYQAEMKAYEQDMQQYQAEGEAYRMYQQQMAEFQAEEERKQREQEGLAKWEQEQAHTLRREKEVKKAVGYNKHGVKAPPLPSREREPEEEKLPSNVVPPTPMKPVKPKLPALPTVQRQKSGENAEEEGQAEEPRKGGSRGAAPPLPSREPKTSNTRKQSVAPPLPLRGPSETPQFKIKPTTINRKGRITAAQARVSEKSGLSALPAFMKPSTMRRNPFQPSMVESTEIEGEALEKIKVEKEPTPTRAHEPRAGIGSVMLKGVKLKETPKLVKQPSASDLMLSQIKKGEAKLRHISRLPDLKKVSQKVQNTLLRRLKARLEARRADIEGSDESSDSDDDDDSDW